MSNNTFRDREILTTAQAKGPVSTLGAWLRLSGPGWLQSAITLGGGSLGGALYLGMLGGTSMLWLQMIAIIIGVIMLSAISYVALSTQKRPYAAINEHVNPILGVGWITATILANMIFILPQFALCYTALNDSLFPGLEETFGGIDPKLAVSLIIGAIGFAAAVFSFKPGPLATMFDLLLKLMVGIVVLCFVAAAYVLATEGSLNWAEIAQGFIPNFLQWNQASPEIQNMLMALDGEPRTYFEEKIINKQQQIMIGVTATAVGLNMTFLLPYSMISRGWDKNFRGFARWELITAMAIPFILVTSCIVIASAHAFHAKADDNFLSANVAEVQESHLLAMASGALKDRYEVVNEDNTSAMSKLNEINDIEIMDGDKVDGKATAKAKKEATHALMAEFVTTLSEEERKLSLALVKPNAKQLAVTLKPALEKLTGNEKAAEWVFGIGALAMGFSTIIILMLINGYAFAEILGDYDRVGYRILGAGLALITGISWVWVWGTQSQTWLIVVASTFGGILLPIAYFSFFLLMNNRDLLGENKPTGTRMTIWNILMLIGVVGAVAQAYGAILKVMANSSAGPYVIGGVVAFLVLALIGFSAIPRTNYQSADKDPVS